MNPNDKQSQLHEASVSRTRMEKLKALSERAANLGQGSLKERVAVPSPTGGYFMEVRDIKS